MPNGRAATQRVLRNGYTGTWRNAGGMGIQEPHEIQQEQVRSPDLGVNNPLQ